MTLQEIIPYAMTVLAATPAAVASGMAGNAAYDGMLKAREALKKLFGDNAEDLEQYAAHQDEASLQAALKMLLKNDANLQAAIAELAQQYPLPASSVTQSISQTNSGTITVNGSVQSTGDVAIGHKNILKR